MNAWMLAATVMLFALVPCGIISFKGSPMDRVVGLELTGIVASMLLLMLAEGMGNPNFYDVGLAMALLAFGGGMVFVRFMERYL